MSQKLVGAAEIGTMLGLSRQRVYQLTVSPEFPSPVAVLRMGKIWRYDDVRDFAKRTGRVVRPIT